MLIYAGIDEAGYGPMLGPLCVAASVFRLPEHDPETGAPNLWKALDKAVCRLRGDRRRRIAIDDSKKLKGAKDGPMHPLTHLERGVLSFVANLPRDRDEAADHERFPATDAALFDRLQAKPGTRPWYDSVTPLPLAQSRDQLGIAASRLERAMGSCGISHTLLRCTAIDAAEFNREVELTRSKATVNTAAALRLVDKIWQRWPGDHPRVILDHHGGRVNYRDDLMLAWPGAQVQVLAENARLSRYRLSREDGSRITLTFQTEAECAHLPVALASMTAKLTRELMMLRLNRFFTAHLPELKPTAGYVQDARRYIADIAPLVTRLGLPKGELIRSV